MSDTANPVKLASAPLAGAAEFDARLKRSDEDRWLATRYAPDAARELLVALYLMDQELRRALATREPMLGKIRIQWWRETLEQVAGNGPVRRHDLAEELARVTAGRAHLIAPINDLIDRYDDIIDDHLHAGGHEGGDEHEDRHRAAERAAVRLAGLALDPKATREQLDLLGACASEYLAVKASLPDAEATWSRARRDARSVPPPLWPAILHLATGDTANGKAPFLKRWRMFWAMSVRRL